MDKEIRKMIDEMIRGLNTQSMLSTICQMSDQSSKKGLTPKEILKDMKKDGFFIEEEIDGKPQYAFSKATISILEAFAFTQITSMQKQLDIEKKRIKRW